jgi:hypothetical protein
MDRSQDWLAQSHRDVARAEIDVQYEFVGVLHESASGGEERQCAPYVAWTRGVWARHPTCALTALALGLAGCEAPSASETHRSTPPPLPAASVADAGHPAATVHAVARRTTDSPIAATAYPAPMQTLKSVEATELAGWRLARETAAATGRDRPVTADDMVRYANPVLGLAFAYPRQLGDVQFAVWPGDDGETWRLGFSRYDALVMAGISPDFSEGRGGVAEDTLGYARGGDGTVRWLDAPAQPDGTEIEVDGVITASSGSEIVLFQVPPMFGSEPGPPAALVNLAGNHFPGMIVLNRDPARLPAGTLRAMLQTIEVSDPRAPQALPRPSALEP